MTGHHCSEWKHMFTGISCVIVGDGISSLHGRQLVLVRWGVEEEWGQSVSQWDQTSWDAKSFLLGLSSHVVILDQAHLKDVYKSTFLHACYSGALPFFACFQGIVIHVEPVLELLCVTIDLPVSISKRSKVLIPISSSSNPIFTVRTKLHLMQKHAWILCSFFLWTAWTLCIQITLGLHEY